ncbi:hypothetical protein [Xanthomonas translucens]|uniref:hypothetical protein n=1 Tax=Xanthomonas campestris pv. translucens TaxID=343 RepID=UPI00071E708F|nr:hypothetical protein [Xanthomonas translucens]KTF40466.1 hypothetical protein OZ12_06715 [Xanthomonas translucens pv. translucens]KWV16891.1 hypothetical protein ATB54_07295 [Xanthomonas translucens]MCS3358849.1 hypothetical protein [Xanthomonas translucens pv. translucens]MCS3373018.1 hypothetical protein [Xanthomonas translucens pv. translucens]MCT8273556.1 hypothetical protein [Xanthomonas translucens pv. translucens]
MPTYRRSHLLPALCALALLGSAPPASADMFGSPEEVARSWVGHDASELMMQWPVDRGLYTAENTETHETAYTYNFGIEEHYRTDYWTTDGRIVGMDGNTPIFEQIGHSQTVFVPTEQHCEVTFVANAEGIITRYDFAGSKCQPYFRGWGRPKKK